MLSSLSSKSVSGIIAGVAFLVSGCADNLRGDDKSGENRPVQPEPARGPDTASDTGGVELGLCGESSNMTFPEYGPEPEAGCEGRLHYELFTVDTTQGRCVECVGGPDQVAHVIMISNPCWEPIVGTVGVPIASSQCMWAPGEPMVCMDFSTNIQTITLDPGESIHEQVPVHLTTTGEYGVEVLLAHDGSILSHEFEVCVP